MDDKRTYVVGKLVASPLAWLCELGGVLFATLVKLLTVRRVELANRKVGVQQDGN